MANSNMLSEYFREQNWNKLAHNFGPKHCTFKNVLPWQQNLEKNKQKLH